MLLLFWCAVGVVAYVYVGYPLVLQLLVAIRGARPVRRGTELPTVSLIVSAFNEAVVIRRKLENALALDYPADKLQIVVISDSSSDETDDIVRSFGDRVELFRQAERRGKTAGLNRVVPQLRGDIVVFSDANAMYERDSVRMLVRNFADAGVGCVTGEARYLKGDQSTASVSERLYWSYEIWIKRLETDAGSMVGGDGAIYGIRRSLWRQLPENAINDFLNPLQIVAAGYRAVYEPEAICYEETAGAVKREWNRRVRIVSRSWRAVFQAGGVLNPFRVGLFAFSLFSHKVLRWFSGAFALLAVIAAGVMVYEAGGFAPRRLILLLAAAAVAFVLLKPLRRVSSFLFYFAVINAASLLGIVRGSLGSVSGVWTTPRGEEQLRGAVRAGIAVLACGLLLVASGTSALIFGGAAGAKLVFWLAIAVVTYVYVVYPTLLHALASRFARPVRHSAIEPRVALLIAANNEADVIVEKLENSLSLDYPANRLSVLVASDGSTDGTNELVASYAARGVTLLDYPERRGKISAINDGMRALDAEIVVLSDANTFLRHDALRKLVRNFADQEVGAVSGDVVLTGERASLAGSEDLYYRYERALQRLESSLGSLIGVDGALYAVRRELFVPPPADTILDDMAIPMAVLRSGRRVVFDADALAEEGGSSSSTEEFSRKSRVVAGAVQFLLRSDSSLPSDKLQPLFSLVSHKALRWLSPAFAALAFAASATLAATSPFFAVVFAAEFAIVSVGIVGCVPQLRRFSPVAVAHYICLVQAAAAVGFLKGLAGRQAVAWRRFARTRVRVQPT
jgi:cellulose synthase/poly-beta-1,6-N-acetylglucosamine synthase-like glycosyltransferase